MKNFRIIKQSKLSQARLGVITTAHGKIQTPFFMPDATRAAVKGLSMNDLKMLGLPAMVINTYHLYLQPGIDLMKKSQGAHHFMNWPKPLLSDSGGYQVYSLIHKNSSFGKITDEKVIFKSPLDGSRHEFTPEKSIQIQFDLGADMIVCLDDCPPNSLSAEKMRLSIKRTVSWAKRCRQEYDRQIRKRNLDNNKPMLFGVIQGGTDLAMRKWCAEELIKISSPGGQGFDGYGYGARPVDGDGKFLAAVLQHTAEQIPADKLRFGLGIGLPEDIARCARMGWDMFDCVIPTREGRHGKLFFWKTNSKSNFLNSQNFYNTINITNAKFKQDLSPINEHSNIPELREHSKAYLHHLLKIQESLGYRLASLNNLEFYLDLMKKIRQAIDNDKL
ncbi:MAG: tRNA guanosine(34) transglycosylase Tgt [bacterium]|nr:tRNA guanosine(34) transglycosylase Tgt [bacterium]